MADKPAPSGGGGSDLWLFVGILLLFFVVWAASGGPSRPISFAGPYLRPISGPGSGAEAYGDPNAHAGFTTGINIGGWGGTISTGSTGSANNTLGTSESASKVSFVPDPTGARESDEDKEYVTLSVAANVSTAGWKLVSQKTGKSAVFPQGTTIPRSGRVNDLGSIQLTGGETVTIVTGRSPLGISFRENKCIGYFEERQDFKPPLPLSCPTAYQEYDRFYDDEDEECLSYIRTIPYCSSDTDVPSSVSNSCEAFVDDYLNYGGCVDAHKNDSDFAGRTWRVYLGKSDELWRKEGETILLLDASGKVVTQFSY